MAVALAQPDGCICSPKSSAVTAARLLADSALAWICGVARSACPSRCCGSETALPSSRSAEFVRGLPVNPNPPWSLMWLSARGEDPRVRAGIGPFPDGVGSGVQLSRKRTRESVSRMRRAQVAMDAGDARVGCGGRVRGLGAHVATAPTSGRERAGSPRPTLLRTTRRLARRLAARQQLHAMFVPTGTTPNSEAQASRTHRIHRAPRFPSRRRSDFVPGADLGAARDRCGDECARCARCSA